MESCKKIIITFGEEEILVPARADTEGPPGATEDWVIVPLNCKRGCSKVNTDLHVNGCTHAIKCKSCGKNLSLPSFLTKNYYPGDGCLLCKDLHCPIPSII